MAYRYLVILFYINKSVPLEALRVNGLHYKERCSQVGQTTHYDHDCEKETCRAAMVTISFLI
jgi:hypothetical protein